MHSFRGNLSFFALIVIATLLLATPTQQVKVKGCVDLVMKTVKACYIDPNVKKDCSKKPSLKGLFKKGKKKSSKSVLDGLGSLCNQCKGCKPNAKACVLTRLGVGSLKKCDLAQKILKGLKKQKN